MRTYFRRVSDASPGSGVTCIGICSPKNSVTRTFSRGRNQASGGMAKRTGRKKLFRPTYFLVWSISSISWSPDLFLESLCGERYPIFISQKLPAWKKRGEKNRYGRNPPKKNLECDNISHEVVRDASYAAVSPVYEDRPFRKRLFGGTDRRVGRGQNWSKNKGVDDGILIKQREKILFKYSFKCSAGKMGGKCYILILDEMRNKLGL